MRYSRVLKVLLDLLLEFICLKIAVFIKLEEDSVLLTTSATTLSSFVLSANVSVLFVVSSTDGPIYPNVYCHREAYKSIGWQKTVAGGLSKQFCPAGSTGMTEL